MVSRASSNMVIQSRGETFKAAANELQAQLQGCQQETLSNNTMSLVVFAEKMIQFHVPDDDDDETNAYRDAISRYLQTGKPPGQPRQVMAAVQPLMRYRLMYHMGDTLGFKMKDLFAAERVEHYTNKIPARFAAVLRKLEVWYLPARKLLKDLETAMSEDQTADIWSESVLNDDKKKDFSESVKNLVRGTINSQRANLHKVKANIQTLAYMMKWHTTSFVAHVKQQVTLVEAASMGLPSLPDEALKLLQDNVKETYTTMRFNFDAAVTVSPLIMLSPLPATKLEINRMAMIDYGVALGKKPHDIMKAENALWDLCMSVANGYDIEPLLRKYAEEYSDPSQLDPSPNDWFIKGRQLQDQRPNQREEGYCGGSEDESHDDGDSHDDESEPAVPRVVSNNSFTDLERSFIQAGADLSAP
ncbi:hypothetical protein HWV62_4407, partial [Athelia sp. TMB]